MYYFFIKLKSTTDLIHILFNLILNAQESPLESSGEHAPVHQFEDSESNDGAQQEGGVVDDLVPGTSPLVNLKESMRNIEIKKS